MLINADDGKSIKIEQIRLMQEKVVEKPIVSAKKVYIINDAERVGKLDVARHAHGEQNGQDHADGNTQKIEEGIPQR